MPDPRQIAPGVTSIAQAKGGHVHAFLLDPGDGRGLTLIDTLYDTDAGRVLAAIERAGRAVADLTAIVLTHAHRSHLGGLAELKRQSGATVHAHAWEAEIVAGRRKAERVSFLPMRPLRAYWRVYHLQFGAALGLGKLPPVVVDHTLADGDRVGPLAVVHTPGHSPGHLAFWWPERRVLFAGDAIATYPILVPGWPAFTLDPVAQAESLRRMAALEPEVVAVGHGEAITGDAAARLRALAHAVP